MGFIDILVIFAVIVFAYTGWRSGFVSGLLSFVGFIGGGLVGSFIATQLLETFRFNGMAAFAITVGSIVALAIVGQILASWLGRSIRGQIQWRPARVVDSFGGAALNVVAIAVIGWMLAATATAIPSSSVATQVRSSQLLSAIDSIVPAPARDFVGNIQGFIDTSGIPSLFDSFGLLPSFPVDPPSTATVSNPAVQRALQSVVKVQGEAQRCGTGSSGSGFIIADQRVMTNAHVIAGVENPSVQVPDVGEFSATTVYFDPTVDIAVLDVPGLYGTPLELAGSLSRGESTVIAGYPGGGPMTATAARVRGLIPAEVSNGSDIYGNTGVMRETYALRGVARPGNSGGPLLTTNGSVGGVVFAQAQSDPDTAYALTTDQVRKAAIIGSEATAEVSTGPCKRS